MIKPVWRGIEAVGCTNFYKAHPDECQRLVRVVDRVRARTRATTRKDLRRWNWVATYVVGLDRKKRAMKREQHGHSEEGAARPRSGPRASTPVQWEEID